MPQAKDYLAMRTVAKGDKVDYGIKGMSWGVRRDRSTLRKAAEARKGTDAAKKTTETTPVKSAASKSTESAHKAPYEGETSSARYARLAAQAKAGKVHDMNEPDLKFFNSRTEAINKVNKMYEAKPNWLKEAAKEAGKNAVKATMNDVAKGVAAQYVSGPLLKSLAGGSEEKAKGAQVASKTIQDVIAASKGTQPTPPAIPSIASRVKAAKSNYDVKQTTKYGPTIGGLGYKERKQVWPPKS